ncbi:MAG: CDP-alcohol phosphatidyltransferase family protein [Planctomycetaceae bacterium]|nr:CDP-alcohol phosphatidyltransferase family protein [Planctomycetaceae bacterium]
MLAYILTFARILLAAAMAALVAFGDTSAALFIALLALAAMEEASDIFDGIAARRAGTASVLGGILDPLADSLARLTIYFALALAGWATLAVPLVMAGRDIIVSYARVVAALSGTSTAARLSGKVKAVIQGAGIFSFIIIEWIAHASSSPTLVSTARVITTALVIAATLWSLADYLRAAVPAARKMRGSPQSSQRAQRAS